MKQDKTKRATKAFERALATQRTGKCVLRLYVAGASARSHQAVLRVRQMCAAELKDGCDLQVIDVYQQPELAREGQIVATPTLVKLSPAPVRRLIGNLAKTTGLLIELNLVAKARAAR